MDSILTSIKKLLGITESDESFDVDIIIHINSVFVKLNQLGIGPEKPFFIRDKSTNWTDFMPNFDEWNWVVTYVYLKVKLLFDPPSNSFTIDAIQKQITELEWRMNVRAEPEEPDSIIEEDDG